MGRAHRKTAKPVMQTGPSAAQKQIAKKRGEPSRAVPHTLFPACFLLHAAAPSYALTAGAG